MINNTERFSTKYIFIFNKSVNHLPRNTNIITFISLTIVTQNYRQKKNKQTNKLIMRR